MRVLREAIELERPSPLEAKVQVRPLERAIFKESKTAVLLRIAFLGLMAPSFGCHWSFWRDFQLGWPRDSNASNA